MEIKNEPRPVILIACSEASAPVISGSNEFSQVAKPSIAIKGSGVGRSNISDVEYRQHTMIGKTS